MRRNGRKTKENFETKEDENDEVRHRGNRKDAKECRGTNCDVVHVGYQLGCSYFDKFISSVIDSVGTGLPGGPGTSFRVPVVIILPAAK